MNALKHGLNARTVVLPNEDEDEDEYNFLLESYAQRLQPAGLVEMANARWRQRRCNKTATGRFEEQMVKQKEQLEAAYESYSEDVEHSFAFRKLSESGSQANLNRMQSQLALRDLLRLHQLREHGEERTESQERTLPNRACQQAILSTGQSCKSKSTGPTRTDTAQVAAIVGVNLANKFRSRCAHPGDSLRPIIPTEPL